MNICPYCGREFEINPFGSGGKNRIYCYQCFPEGLDRQDRQKVRDYLNNAVIIRDKIQRGCDICGYNQNATALEWHHPNDDKDYNPSALLLEYKVEEYYNEIAKCTLLCANCHREIHHPNFDRNILLNDTNDFIQQITYKYPDSVNDNSFYIDLIEQVLNYYNTVQNIQQTASHFGCDKNTISNILKKNGQKIYNQQQGVPVIMTDTDGNMIKVFQTMREAYAYLNKPQGGHIAAVCNGQRKTAYGYKWKYL